ncbi:MAG: mechanosensitive ion channel [Methylocystaceae bacterium]|nr:mechanosensitive ion channel [Methylocystaceae bacterium]
MEAFLNWWHKAQEQVISYTTSSMFATQVGAVLVVVLVSWLINSFIQRQFEKDTDFHRNWIVTVYDTVAKFRAAIFPITIALLLFIPIIILGENTYPIGFIQAVQGLLFLIILYRFFVERMGDGLLKFICLYLLYPMLFLYIIGYLDETVMYLEKAKFEVGNISFNLLTLVRILVFGVILFWLGSTSNSVGKRVIRDKITLDDTAKELSLKAFQISLFIAVGLIFLQIAGIDLTALVVLGGAVGVGLGFGLQQIASNFISGIIILTDRTIRIGDYIEMEDGKAGHLAELSMRSATLRTFEGKDVMVPNERFITTAFTNWTHENLLQRYALHVSVSYDTDLDMVFTLLRNICASHPQVVGFEHEDIQYHPDAEIEEFADSGINILIEFWMEGIDDGRNKVGAEIKYQIWKQFKENNVVIPYPHQEVRIIK